MERKRSEGEGMGGGEGKGMALQKQLSFSSNGPQRQLGRSERHNNYIELYITQHTHRQ